MLTLTKGYKLMMAFWCLMVEQTPFVFPWWLNCLDGGALINVEAPGCGTSVVRGPTGHK